jgi:hypothetical protein
LETTQLNHKFIHCDGRPSGAAAPEVTLLTSFRVLTRVCNRWKRVEQRSVESQVPAEPRRRSSWPSLSPSSASAVIASTMGTCQLNTEVSIPEQDPNLTLTRTLSVGIGAALGAGGSRVDRQVAVDLLIGAADFLIRMNGPEGARAMAAQAQTW